MQTRACSNGHQFMYVVSHFYHKTNNWSASDSRLFLPSLFATDKTTNYLLTFIFFFSLLYVAHSLHPIHFVIMRLFIIHYSFLSLVIVLSAPVDVCSSTVPNIARISLHNHFYTHQINSEWIHLQWPTTDNCDNIWLIWKIEKSIWKISRLFTHCS